MTVLTDLSSKRLILGRAGFIDREGVLLNQRTARLDVHSVTASRVSLAYLCWVLNSTRVREQTIATSRGSTVFHTSPTRMLAARWPLPPPGEQRAIAEILDTMDRSQRAVKERLRQQISLMLDYRTRLIVDIVTGKLDVREAVARLPTELEPEPLDELEPLEDGDEEATDGLSTAAEETEA